MRETSGRLEEIPGEEAVPADLDSSIKRFYERAGIIRDSDGSAGSITMIVTESPAGGNVEEPVTQLCVRSGPTSASIRPLTSCSPVQVIFSSLKAGSPSISPRTGWVALSSRRPSSSTWSITSRSRP